MTIDITAPQNTHNKFISCPHDGHTAFPLFVCELANIIIMGLPSISFASLHIMDELFDCCLTKF